MKSFVLTIFLAGAVLLLGGCASGQRAGTGGGADRPGVMLEPRPLLDEGPLLESGSLLENTPQMDDRALPGIAVISRPSRGARPYTVLGRTYYPLKSAHGYVESGKASWYDSHSRGGRRTASGERYDPGALTAAHRLLPLGSVVQVTHLGTGKSVRVRINDRGPFVGSRIIDLSRAAASELGMIRSGVAEVRVRSVGAVPRHIERNGDLMGDFYIQVGAFAKAGNARRLRDSLQRRGYNARDIRKRGRASHCVQVGPWKDLFAAQHALAALRAEFPRAYVIARN